MWVDRWWEFWRKTSPRYLIDIRLIFFILFYSQLLCSVDTKFLRLTPADEEIYKDFREQFPDFRVDVIDEDHLKSAEQKGVFITCCIQFIDERTNYEPSYLGNNDVSCFLRF
jgi:hypothetical protein